MVALPCRPRIMEPLGRRMIIQVQFRKFLILGMVAALWSVSLLNAETGIEAIPDTTGRTALDRGYLGLYNLDFSGAQKDFSTWQLQHPDDPVGPVSEAAGFLFSEFNRLGVLEAQFFENDSAFASRSKVTADPVVKHRFEAALSRADTLAHNQLPKNSKDRAALFALTLSAGLQADYAALIEK